MEEQRKSPVSNWTESYSRDDLKVLCDCLIHQNDSLIQDSIFLEAELRKIVEAARQAWVVRIKEPAVGLTQLIEAVRQANDRCKKRKQEAQWQRSLEAQEEIDRFRAMRAEGD